eukprot:gene21382-biopygen17652
MARPGGRLASGGWSGPRSWGPNPRHIPGLGGSSPPG